MNSIPDTIVIAVTVGIFVGGTVWALAWWLSGQFSEIRSMIYQQIAKVEANILEKLEYHEKHDDARFSTLDARVVNVRDDLWDMRVRQAAVDGLPALKPRKND